jgi:hypothetical protein
MTTGVAANSPMIVGDPVGAEHRRRGGQPMPRASGHDVNQCAAA